MDLKKISVGLLFFNLILFAKINAQITIIPELSDNYVQKLIDTAKANYPKAKSYQNRINIAKSNIAKSKLSFLESITFSYVYQPEQAQVNPVNPASSYFKGLQAGLFLNIGTLFGKPFLMNQAKESLSIAHHEQMDYLQSLTTEVKKRYYNYVLRLAELKIQSNALQISESSLAEIKHKFEKGEEVFDSYNKVLADYTNHQSSKIQAEAGLFLAKSDLEELLSTKLENIK